MVEPSSDPKPALHSMLRAATAAEHARLEACLALLEPPLDPARFLTILQGFWGFHRVWEPLLAARRLPPALLDGRSKLPILTRDLKALGMTAAAIEALPLCNAVQALGGLPERMLGGIYVMEGSTLGGQVIGRALRDQAWLPAGGLQYFNPYGTQTGAMWRHLCAALDAASSAQADAQIIAGAKETFDLLTVWLAARLAD